MKLTLQFVEFAAASTEVEDSATVASLKQHVEFTTGLLYEDLELFHNNQKLSSDSVPLKDAGVTEGATVHVRQKSQGQNPSAGSGQESQVLTALRSNPQLLQALPPHLRQRVQSNDASVVPEVLGFVQAQEAARRQEEIDALNFDEFDPEAQSKIAERIRNENIQANMEAAYEHSPEVFGEINMLYVNLAVNGNPLKAFVDSGAQACVMSLKCAEECNISHLIDKRYQGIMQGVGTSKIYGRVHSVSVRVASEHVPMAVTIIEHSEVDLLFGLDMLRRYRCKIDLDKNCLTFGILNNLSLDFLPDHEIPRKGSKDLTGGASASAAAAAAASARAAAGSETLLNPQPSTSQPDKAAPSTSAAQPAAGPAANPSSRTPQEPGGTPAADQDLEAKIAQLTSLGFPRQMSVEALSVCGGNVEQAASLLFTQ